MKAAVFSPLEPEAREQLEAAMDVAYFGWAEDEPVVTPLPGDQEIIEHCREVQVIITPGELSREVMASCPQLQIVGVARGDTRGVDADYARERGIKIVDAAGRNAVAVAELTIGMMITLSRRICQAEQFVRAGKFNSWDALFATELINGWELAGKNLGLIGMGIIGKEVARRAQAFDLSVVAFDPFVPEKEMWIYGVTASGLEDLLTKSDIISIHCKLSPDTEGLLGKKELALLHPGAILVNTARAGIIDQEAFLDMMQEGRIAGAAIDVYWEEPLPLDSPLLGLPNILMTPHIGGSTVEVEQRTGDLVVTRVLAKVPSHDSSLEDKSPTR